MPMKAKRWIGFVLITSIFIGLSPSALGAMDMFIKIDDLKGEAIDTIGKHSEEIEVLAWSWGMQMDSTLHSGTGGGSGRVDVQDLSLTKYVDKASPALLLKCANSEHYNQATLTIRSTGITPVDFIKITMTDLIVTSVQTGGGGGDDRLREEITLNFVKVKVEYVPTDPQGVPGPSVDMIWDIVADEEG